MDNISWKDKEANTLQLFEGWVIRTPNRRAVVFEPGVSATFRELWEISGKIYAHLKARGIGREDVVMYHLPRGIELYACMLGTMRAGAAFTMVETGTDPERTAFIRKDSGCKLLVDEGCIQEILEADPLEGYEEVNLHSLLYIVYTSGTTGHPKGVLHEYGSLDNSWKSVIFNGEPILNDNDTFLNTSPIPFVATTINFSFTCAFGTAIAMMPYNRRNDREAFSDYLKKANVNCGYLTPTLLRRHLPFDQPWRMCVLASEPVDGLYIQNMRCYNCYASSESGCWIAGYEIKKPMTPTPVGISHSDVVVTIVDDDGNEVQQGSTGEICFKTPYVRGYVHQIAAPFEKRIFHTKDAGKKDSDGNIIVVGRMDEMFKVSGYRIEPAEVEKAVKAVSGLKNLVVRGFVYKDVSSISVFYTDEIKSDPVMIHEKLLQLLPEYMIPTNYIHMNEFPLLPSGKIDKQKILPPEGSWEQFKNNPVPVLPLTDSGENFEIYDIGCGKAVKRFRSTVPYDRIRREQVSMQKAYESGVSKQNAYAIVRFESDYGILMDKDGSKA